MVIRIEMDAEDVSNEVRRYSILVGFLLIVVFVVPCVGFALFSKHCQKQTRKRRHQPTVASLLQMQHRSSVFLRNIPISEQSTPPTRESPPESSIDYCSYGPLGQVECPLENLEGAEKMCSMGACLSCLDMWKVRIPSAVPDKEVVGKLIVVKKISAVDAKAHIPCLKADLANLSHIPPHPFLLNLLGVFTNGGVPQALVLEYPLHGSFHSFLVTKRKAALSGDTQYWLGWTQRNLERNVAEALRTELTTLCPLLANPDYRHHPYAQPMNASFTDVDSLLFALQIASAMDHLTQRNILHKGLSSENLMIGSEFYLKLTGVHTDNSSRHKEPSMRQLKRTPSGRNLYKWDAPEVMETGYHTEKTEVWRFGMTMWEVTSLGDIPFADTPNRTLSDMVRSGQRPHVPDFCSQRLYQLMTECWDLNPDSRPTFTRILERIQDMVSFRDGRSRSSETNAPDQALLHHRPRRGKRPLYHSTSSPALISDDPSSDCAPIPPPPLKQPQSPISPLMIKQPQSPMIHKVVLEEIPESFVESDV